MSLRIVVVLGLIHYYCQYFTLAQYLLRKNSYHSHQEMTKELHHIAAVYPNRAHLYSVGTSVEGRELWVIALANDKPDKHIPLRPEISLVGNMHGDEAVGRELLLYLAAYLLEFYDYDPMVREIMDNSRVHIMPSMNPDGFAMSVEGTCDSSIGRGNARKIDLNRNFPDYWESNDVEREPETQAVMEWLNKVPFVLASNFHGGAVVANYPFDNNKEGLIRYSETPDDDILQHLALLYSKTHQIMYNGKTCGDSLETFDDGITNGADWYPVTGSLQDYQYAFKGIMATTMEISCCKYPLADTLTDYWLENKLAMLEYMKQANTGVRGFVVDSQTGAGIQAVMHIHGRKMKFTSLPNGEYYRILLPGVYTIKVQSMFNYYEPKSVTFLIPKTRLLTELNVSLTPAVPTTTTTSSNLSTVQLQSKSSTKFLNTTTKEFTSSEDSYFATTTKPSAIYPITDDYDNTVPNHATQPTTEEATVRNSLDWFVTEIEPSILIEKLRKTTTKYRSSTSTATSPPTVIKDENPIIVTELEDDTEFYSTLMEETSSSPIAETTTTTTTASADVNLNTIPAESEPNEQLDSYVTFTENVDLSVTVSTIVSNLDRVGVESESDEQLDTYVRLTESVELSVDQTTSASNENNANFEPDEEKSDFYGMLTKNYPTSAIRKTKPDFTVSPLSDYTEDEKQEFHNNNMSTKTYKQSLTCLCLLTLIFYCIFT